MRRTISACLTLVVALLVASVPARANKPNGAGKSASVHAHGQNHSNGPNHANGPKTNPGSVKASGPKVSNGAGPKSSAPILWTPTNPVAEKLATKPNLLARVHRSLPGVTDLNAATAGFKNFGQFIAATNVSRNLGIDFGLLKSAMTGVDLNGVKTGQPTLSLGQAIQKLRPGADGTTEARKAETLAHKQIESDDQ